MIAIRGATTVEDNTSDEILASAKELLTEILQSNCLDISDIISVIFTATNDLDQVYPAVAARELGITEAGLMCQQEMNVAGSLPKCLRIMIFAETGTLQSSARHIYMKGAVKLRPELSGPFAVAIDGPAGVGKGTVAKKLADSLNYIYVDTGAMYRAVAYFCVRNGISPSDASQVESVLPELGLSVEYKNNHQRLLISNTDVTDALRTPDISEASSKVAAISAVREKLLHLQRDIAADKNVVMEGRDIGTRVLPDAQVKIYLDAGIEERARRRFNDRASMGIGTDLDAIKRELEERDYRDTQREYSPLKRAAGAVLIDSTNMDEPQVVEAALRIVYDKTGGLYGICAS